MSTFIGQSSRRGRRGNAIAACLLLLAASGTAAAAPDPRVREPLPRQLQEQRQAQQRQPQPQPRQAQPQPTGSLFKQGLAMTNKSGTTDSPNGATPISQLSYFAVPPRVPRKLRKHDLVTIDIRENSDSSTTGQMDSQKQQDFNAAIQQFLQLRFSGNGLPYATTVSNPANLPQVQVHYDNNRKNNATDQRTDAFSARITAEIVDIKPNGTLVLEATKRIRVDHETQTFRLSGICRARDVSIDNTVLSTQLANLRLTKKTTGAVRDGTKRGWLNKVLDTVNPF